VEHAGEDGALVQKYRPAADAALEDEKMEASIPLVEHGEDAYRLDEAGGVGRMEATLREQGVITRTLGRDAAYTMQFIEEIYGSRAEAANHEWLTNVRVAALFAYFVAPIRGRRPMRDAVAVFDGGEAGAMRLRHQRS